MLKKIKLFICTALLTISFFTAKAQDEITLELTTNVNAAINAEKATLESLKNDLCKQVDALSYDVTKLGNGSLSYPNWVRFVQIAEQIDSLNGVWNEAYGNALESIIQVAVDEGQIPDDDRARDLASDIIEEDYLIFPADIASVCFETKFDFTSLRKCLEDQEDNWLENQEGEFSGGDAPTIAEDIDDEMFWTLITCEKQFVIEDKNVDETMLDGMTDEQKKDIIATIKDIVSILSDIVNLAEQVRALFEDCAGSTAAKNKDIRFGFEIPNTDGNKMIGYTMKQKGILIDFHATNTKIYGKAKIWKKNKRGKFKKDRKSKVGIAYCAKEFNNCEDKDWPSDPGFYSHPDKHKNRKVAIQKSHYHPYALSIEKSSHFVQFHFYYQQNYVKSILLLGGNGCF